MWNIKIFWLALLTLLFTGCLRDDLSDCDQGIELIFGYTHHNYGTDLFESEVSQVMIVVFDDSGTFTSLFEEKTTAVNGVCKMSLPLLSGTYTLLVWGGDLDTYHMDEFTSVDDFSLLLHTDVTPSPLYYARQEVRVVSGKQLSYKVDLMKNSSSVRFRIKETVQNTSRIRAGWNVELPFDIELSGNNTMIDGHNRIMPHAPKYNYLPVASAWDGDEEVWCVDYRLMRLMIEHPVVIRINDRATDTILLEEDLISLILDYKTKYITQSDIDKEDEFLIELDIDRSSSGGDVSVSIRINGWEIFKLKPIV